MERIITFLKLFFAQIILFVFAYTAPALAESYNLIQTLPGTKSFTRGPNLIETYLSFVFGVVLGIAAILAVLMIVVGGVRYVLTSVSPSEKENAKKMISNAIFGLLLVLASYLLLQAINPDLVKIQFQLDQLPAISSGGGSGSSGGGASAGGATGGNSPQQIQQEFQMRQQLSQMGISVNKSMCPSPTTPYQQVSGGCTNVAGTHQKVITGLGNLNNNCSSLPVQGGCNLTITGGTEAGHQTHCVGCATVDLSKDAGLNTYVLNNGTQSGTVGGFPQYTLPDGSTYVDEGNHWHVTFP
tara:strand:- start:2362 stop:3255 length:894 start_codon:yes stop_codon:yes gene_type:complete